MNKFWSELFLSCMAWMYAAMILFSLVCLTCFEATLVSDQILKFYGSVMLTGAASGAIWYYYRIISKMKRPLLN